MNRLSAASNLLCALLLALAACQGPATHDSGTAADSGSNSCIPGATTSCTCSTGSTGTAVCGTDGIEGACSCDAGPSDAGQRGGSGDAGPDAGCTTSQTMACECGDGMAGTQTCENGAYGACQCESADASIIETDGGVAGVDAGTGGLGAFNVSPDTVTVSGISAGGFMAVQLFVAYSASIHGAAIFAGGPYDCYQGMYTDLTLAECTTGLSLSGGVGSDVPKFVSYTNAQADMGTIDPVSNMAGKPIYMFSGTQDSIINQSVMNALEQYFEAFTASSNITYNNSTAAEHAWITPDATNACNILSPPYLDNCNSDVEQTFLTLFYGTLAPRTSSPEGNFVQFQQDPYCPGGSCAGIGMDSTAWLYVPSGCAAGQACKLVVVLHGCSSDQEDIGTALIHMSGVDEWADNNNILVLYPQARDASQSDCWDFTAYTGANYDLKSAPQMTAIMSMVHQITSG